MPSQTEIEVPIVKSLPVNGKTNGTNGTNGIKTASQNGHSTNGTKPASQNGHIDRNVEVNVEDEIAEHLKFTKTSNQILDIVARYGTREKEYEGQPYQAKKTFLPCVLDSVKSQSPVKLVLPAFPFKSPNRQNKVLGNLPDLGEEMALANLQSLCDSIRQVYAPGAVCYITSDGLVYNDLLGVDDLDVWLYGEALREMAKEKKLRDIKFLRLTDLLEVPHHRSRGTGLERRELSTLDEKRIHYLTHACCTRRELIARYTPAGFDADKTIKEDTDTCLTYQGYLRFLKKDLEHEKWLKFDEDDNPFSAKKTQRMISDIAKRMIARGAAFAAAIRDTYGDCVRLSIHPTVAVTKFPINLLPQRAGEFGLTPWHSSLALNLDGTFSTGHAGEFAKTYDRVYHRGRPYYFRERSALFDWSDAGLDVEFEPLYPCGIIARPLSGRPSARQIPMLKVRELCITLSPVVMRGFADTVDEELYLEKGREIGTIAPWTFGLIQKVKDEGSTTKMGNNVTSNEPMPMHFDGTFKFEDQTDPETGVVTKVQIPPAFQFFTTPIVAPEGTGYTLFASSALFFKYLPAPYSTERFERILWNLDNDGYWENILKDQPLVIRHPANGTPCVRWHEPWDSSKTKFSTCTVTLSNDDPAIIDVVTKMLYDYRVCLRFTWHVGDWVVSDNISMLHTRTGYTSGCPRELWRIHFD